MKKKPKEEAVETVAVAEEAKAPENALVVTHAVEKNPYARAKGKLEFIMREAGQEDSDIGGRVVINEHPLRPTNQDQWMVHIRQLAHTLPSYFDQLGHTLDITLIASYEIFANPRTSEVKITLDLSEKHAFETIIYDSLIQPLIILAGVPNPPVDEDTAEEKPTEHLL